MKSRYLKIKVRKSNYDGLVEVYDPIAKCWRMVSDDDENIVLAEDIETAGAVKLMDALNYLAFVINNNGEDAVKKVFGRTSLDMILCEFTSKEIIEKVKELDAHVPTVGDIYESRKSGNKVAVLSYNEETHRVRFMGGSYITNGSVEDFDKMFSFTGCCYGGINDIANELYSEEGDKP